MTWITPPKPTIGITFEPFRQLEPNSIPQMTNYFQHISLMYEFVQFSSEVRSPLNIDLSELAFPFSNLLSGTKT